MTTHTNALQRPSEARRGLSRWEEVLAPSYRVIAPQNTSQRLTEPRWLQWTREHDAAKEVGR